MLADDIHEVTRCENCEHLHPTSRGERRERTALCMAHPKLVRADLVFNGIIDKDTPFMRCIDINGGACPMYKPRIVGESE